MGRKLPDDFATKRIIFCQKCGAVVIDWEAHERFHAIFEHVIKNVHC